MRSICRLLSGVALLVGAGCSIGPTTQPTSSHGSPTSDLRSAHDEKVKDEPKKSEPTAPATGNSGPVMTMHRVQAGKPDQKGWCVAESTNGGFVVELPGLFNDFTQIGKATDGAVVTISTVGMRTPGGIKYSATSTRRSDDKLKTSSFDTLADNFGRDLKERKPITHITLTGEQFTVGNAQRCAILRYLRSENTLYFLAVENEMGASFSPDEQRDANFFLDSFLLSPNGRK